MHPILGVIFYEKQQKKKPMLFYNVLLIIVTLSLCKHTAIGFLKKYAEIAPACI
jgi:hypothetical protein